MKNRCPSHGLINVKMLIRKLAILLALGEIYGHKRTARYFTMWTASAYGKYYVTATPWNQDGEGNWHLSPDKSRSLSFQAHPHVPP